MKLYVFSSDSFKNIWTGYKQKIWAVSPTGKGSFSEARATRARQMPKYSRGIIYCSGREKKKSLATKRFLMPFVTMGLLEDRPETRVWEDAWHFPFQIKPLLDPSNPINDAGRFPGCKWNDAIEKWPIFRRADEQDKPPESAVNGIQGATIFIANEISDDEWRMMLIDIGADPDADRDYPQPEEPEPESEEQRNNRKLKRQIRAFVEKADGIDLSSEKAQKILNEDANKPWVEEE